MCLLDNAITQTPIWFTILISVLSSAVISAIVTGLITYKMKFIDFKFDYKKYTLKKRIEAYEKLRPVIVALNQINIITTGSYWGKKIHKIFNVTFESDPLRDYLELLHTTVEFNVFYSDKFYQLLSRLNSILENVIKDPRYNQNPTLQPFKLEELAISHFDELAELRLEMLDQFFIDLTKLDDIKEFKSKKIHR